MTNSRSKTPGAMSATCITHLEDWAKYQIFKRRKNFSGKQIEKGLDKEADAIVFMAEFYGWDDAVKNETEFEDDWFTGTPDVIGNGIIADIKCSWDCYTFPMFATAPPTKGYEWQLQIYMELLKSRKIKKASLDYCLMNAPEHLIDKAAFYAAKDLGLTETPVELFEQMKSFMTYENLPKEVLIKSFPIEHDLLKIAQLQERVTDCRAYIKKFIQPTVNHIKL